MKATILTTVFAALVFSINTNAQDVMTYSNVERNELGTMKEYVSIDSETLVPQTKELYTYDVDGKIIKKIVSKWGGSDTGWVNKSKHEYTYGNADSDLVTLIAYTMWNENTNDWSEKSDLLINMYDEDNNYMATLYDK